MKIYIGADHGGYALKEEIKTWLKGLGFEASDMGAESLDSDDDYVDYAVRVAREVRRSPENMGILICRNGMGMTIASNRLAGVRCGLGFSKEAVEKGRSDDDINCLALPADYIDINQAKEMCKIFMETAYSGEERYNNRLKKLANI